MNTSLVNTMGCIRLLTCLECVINGCDWVIHTSHPPVCTHNFRLSPFEISEVVQNDGICPPIVPEPVTDVVVVNGTSDWVIVIIAFAMLFLGIIGTIFFWRARNRVRNQRAREMVQEMDALVQPPPHMNWFHNYEQRQLEQRIRGVAQLAGLPENDANVRNAIARIDEELGWRAHPAGGPNREDGNLLLQAEYFGGEDDIVVLADDPPPPLPQAQVRRRLPEPLVLLRDNAGLNAPRRTRSGVRY